MGADVHTCWEKFARYFEVEPRVIPLEEDRFTIAAEQVEPLLDERTIGVAGPARNDLHRPAGRPRLDRRAARARRVTSAAGGSRCTSTPPRAGSSRRSRAPSRNGTSASRSVRSINVSNHKFGLVYPGMGTVVFRDASDLPEELIFHINYLGGDMPNYSLNFSRPSSSVILQYFAFLRLGLEGYEEIVDDGARQRGRAREQTRSEIDGLRLITDGSEFPIVTLRAEDPERTDLTSRLAPAARARLDRARPTRCRRTPST